MPWSARRHHGLQGCPWTALSLVSPYLGGPTVWEGEGGAGEKWREGRRGEGREGGRDDGEDERVQEDKGQNEVSTDTTLHFYRLYRMTQALTS